MKQIITFKEYDKIVSESKYNGDVNTKPLKDNIFNELIEFIREYEIKEEKKDEDILKFMKISYSRTYGDIILFKNYVGLIQLKSGTQLQILPKIYMKGENDNTNDSETLAILKNMILSMNEFENKFFNTADLDIAKTNIFEVFISMYINQVKYLIKKGLKSSYIINQSNSSYIKCKILVKENIKENYIHKERVFCEYDEYQLNRPENKIIKATLLKLQKLSTNNTNIKNINQLLIYFSLVDEAKNYNADFAKITIDRSNKDYELLMDWSKIFLKNKSFITFSGASNSKSLLFQMDKLFEAYIAKLLKRYVRNKMHQDWNIKAQSSKLKLFESPDKFMLKPDIIIENEKNRVILDTKWKILKDSKEINYNISQSDMYQMYAYSKRYNSKNIWLIYPLTKEMEKYTENEIIYETDNKKTIVRVFFIDLNKNEIDKSLKNLLEKIYIEMNE